MVVAGVDASRAVRPVLTGTETYSLELISALLGRAASRRYRLYFDRMPGPSFPSSPRAERTVIPSWRGWTHFRLGPELRSRPPDLLFVPSHVIPVGCPVPAVATIHDLGYLWHRSAYTPAAWLMLHLGTLWNARVARVIVADSQATAGDLVTHFGVSSGRIRVAYLGGPRPCPVVMDPSVLDRYGLPSSYFLFVGTIQPRKNLARLLRAFAALRPVASRPVGLVLAGQPGPGARALRELARDLRIDDRVSWLGYVSAHDRQILVAGATGFVFPSLYEGFGMPVLEAMAWGCPVVSSSSSSLPEVVGDAGLLVDPYDVAGLTQAMAQLLDDVALRERLIARGRERAATFTWDRCAGVVESALDDALTG